jgi:hypothetical protein
MGQLFCRILFIFSFDSERNRQIGQWTPRQRDSFFIVEMAVKCLGHSRIDNPSIVRKRKAGAVLRATADSRIQSEIKTSYSGLARYLTRTNCALPSPYTGKDADLIFLVG